MKKVEIFGNWLIVVVISIITIYSFDYYKSNYTVNTDRNIIYIFSAKDIIENKNLNIKKAILNNTDVKKEENNLIDTIQTIDNALKEISIKLEKPIFAKESILSGNTKDITPLVVDKLKEKGLLE